MSLGKLGAALVTTGMVVCALSHEAAAQGNIVYVNAGDHKILTPGGVTLTFDVDMDSNGTVDFIFRAGSQFDIYSTTGNRTIGVPQGGNDFGSFSMPLSAGFEIGPSLAAPLGWEPSFQPGFPPGEWIGPALHVANNQGTFGYWQPRLTGYLGAEFQIEGAVHYGWIQLTTPFFPGVNGGTIHDWAYNTLPGEMILAGQVAEPSTWALLIGGGALIWWRFRKGRSA